jgi:hypothetical protein
MQISHLNAGWIDKVKKLVTQFFFEKQGNSIHNSLVRVSDQKF